MFESFNIKKGIDQLKKKTGLSFPEKREGIDKLKKKAAKASWKIEQEKKQGQLEDSGLMGVGLEEENKNEDVMGENTYGNKKVYRGENIDPYISAYLDNLPDTQDLDGYLKSFELSSLEEQEAEDVAFEDRDIMGEQIAEIRGKKEAQKKEAKIEKKRQEILKQKMLDYSPFEFKSMQNAFRFKTFLDKFPGVEEARPKNAEGKVLSDSEIEALIKQYNRIKDNISKRINKWGDFNPKELKFMKKCAIWGSIAKEYRKHKKMERPAFADGKEMTVEQINELSNEYKDLEQNDPKTFAELKFENGEWGKGEFNWKKEEFKGKNQYSSVLKEKGKITKFIIREEDLPKDFKLENKRTTNFYSIINSFEASGNKFLYIKLRKPYATQEVKKEETTS